MSKLYEGLFIFPESLNDEGLDNSINTVKNELINLTNLAFEKDIFGAPTFVVNNKIFWGQDRLEYALEEIGAN